MNLRSETSSYEGLRITLLHLPEQELRRLPWKLNVSDKQSTWVLINANYVVSEGKNLPIFKDAIYSQRWKLWHCVLFFIFQHDYPIFKVKH